MLNCSDKCTPFAVVSQSFLILCKRSTGLHGICLYAICATPFQCIPNNILLCVCLCVCKCSLANFRLRNKIHRTASLLILRLQLTFHGALNVHVEHVCLCNVYGFSKPLNKDGFPEMAVYDACCKL